MFRNALQTTAWIDSFNNLLHFQEMPEAKPDGTNAVDDGKAGKIGYGD
jgi:hypothetical protein